MGVKQFIATKAFIVNNGKILIIRESSKYEDGTNHGKYDVPGGRVEPGQKWDESLLREIKEETGLDVKIGRSFYVGEWMPNDWQIIGVFFECFSDSDDVKLSSDHDDFKWIDPKDYKESDVIDEKSFEAYLR